MGHICGNGEDLEVCVITWSRMGWPRGGREEVGKDNMKEKMKSDLVDPWIHGQSKGGRGGAGTVRGRKLIPSRCCANADRGYQITPLAHRAPPHASMGKAFYKALWMVRGGRAAGGSRLSKDKIYTHARMGTMDPEILMSMVVSHRNRHKGVCFF